MKRIGSIFALLLMLCITVLPGAAYAESSQLGLPLAVDTTGTLDMDELNDIDLRLNELKSEYDSDIVFVISDNFDSSDIREAADDYFDYNGYGPDGILYLVSPSKRKYAFSTTGTAVDVFNTEALEYINEKILDELEYGNYYGVASVYAESCGEVLEAAAIGKSFKKKANPLFIYGGIFLIPLVVAFILMYSKLSAMKTAVKSDSAASYVKDNSMKINRMNDIFMYSTISRTVKPKENESRGGTHTSSSGREHGGMSGSF